VLEGTVIDTVLTNRLDGSSASPVNCLVTNALTIREGHRVKVYLTSDIELPTYTAPGAPN
jgi:hypothetical protein